MVEKSSNTTIAKNTFFLYTRSILIMAVTLFSSRVILQALGVEDYGLYGAIGSVVSMFSIMNGLLSAGTSRFLTFELGRQDEERLKKTFSASFTMHFALSLILFVILETFGVWFVKNKLNIPEGREFAAYLIFQISILDCMLSLTQVPYSASIIAHEKMKIYAYIGIIEVFFKLALIFTMLYVPFGDNLIAYAAILAIWKIGLQIWYRFYCRKNFTECKLFFVKDKSIYKTMLSYSMWDFLGSFCSTGINQGLNILINLFFGVTLNAARSIALQVEAALQKFSNDFLTAVNPQIVKNYASKDYNRFFLLISSAGKYAFFLLYMVTMPVFLETKIILSLWLVEVPENTVVFMRVIMLISLFRVIARPLINGVHATGNIKFLNLSSGLTTSIIYLPTVYILFKLNLPFWTMFFVQCGCALISTILEIWSLRREFDFSIGKYLLKSYVHSFFVVLLASIAPTLVVLYMKESFLRLVLSVFVSLLSSTIIIYCLGLDKETKSRILTIIKNKFRRNI